MKNILLLILLCVLPVLFWQCNNASNNAEQSNKQPEPASIKLLPLYLIDSVEHMFGNENWQLTSGTDTSYLLFSRQNETSIKVYHYKMRQGDSAENYVSFIKLKNDTVVWDQPGHKLLLRKTAEKYIDWRTQDDSTVIIYRQTGKDKIVNETGSVRSFLRRTLTMSDFLVRSRYDYLHGTHYAVDTITFNWRKLKKDSERKLINRKG